MRCYVSLVAALGVLVMQMAGCDLQVELTNAPPRVTWAHAEPAGDALIDLTLWVYDLEQNPVDLTLTWSLDGIEQGPLSLASGGHGTLGLSTSQDVLEVDGRPDPDGQPHLIRWALPAELSEGARLQVHALADDRVSEPGPMASTPSEGFTASAGLEVTRLISSP